MALEFLASIGMWLVDKFSKKKTTDQSQKIFLKDCPITINNLPIFKDSAKEVIKMLQDKHNIPQNEIDSYFEMVDDSTTPDAFIGDVESISGSTADASGTSKSEVEKFFIDEFEKIMWTCPRCGNVNTTPTSLFCYNSTCAECGYLRKGYL